MNIKNFIFIFISIFFYSNELSNESIYLDYIEEILDEVQNTLNDISLAQNFSGKDLIYFKPNCESKRINNSTNEIIFSNCSLSGILDFSILLYEFSEEKIELIDTIFDLDFEEMIFKLDLTNNVLDFKIPSKSIFDMNLNKPVFHSPLLSNITSYYEIFAEQFKNDFVNRMKSILKIENDNNKKVEFYAILSLFLIQKPHISNNILKENEINITYFNPYDYSVEDILITQDKLRIGKLILNVEYSINYNLSYNEIIVIFEHYSYEKEIKYVDGEVIDIKKENKFNESLIPIVSEKIYFGLYSAFKEYKGRKQNEDFLDDKSYSKIKTDL
jgi:hypothetical protein